jgi:hypothetical protein
MYLRAAFSQQQQASSAANNLIVHMRGDDQCPFGSERDQLWWRPMGGAFDSQQEAPRKSCAESM